MKDLIVLVGVVASAAAGAAVSGGEFARPGDWTSSQRREPPGGSRRCVQREQWNAPGAVHVGQADHIPQVGQLRWLSLHLRYHAARPR